MDFVIGFPRTLGKFNAILVIMDKTKSAHFIHVQTTNNFEKFAKIYICKIVCLHRLTIPIILYCGTQFTSSL